MKSAEPFAFLTLLAAPVVLLVAGARTPADPPVERAPDHAVWSSGLPSGRDAGKAAPPGEELLQCSQSETNAPGFKCVSRRRQ